VVRKAGFALLILGLAVVAWVGATAWWGDPFTSLYTKHQQHALSRQLDVLDREWAGKSASGATAELARRARIAKRATLAAQLRTRARSFAGQVTDGSPIGRIVIPRIGLKIVVVEGTTEHDLESGPGHYNSESGAATGLPGMGKTIGIAGHRTTFLHPFRHIDELKSGDRIYLEMPYGTFRYTVFMHRIVDSHDWSILRSRPFEKLVLSACHPLYSATHRWVVFAKLTGVARTVASPTKTD
jgi:sortase A